MLEAVDVSYRHGDRGSETGHQYAGVRGVSLSLTPGTIAGLIGPNGSGKTTLLRVLSGALGPESGRVTLDGRNLVELPRREVARRVAVVPQETHLAFDYLVLEIALMGRYPHLRAFELEGPDDLAIAMDALSATGTAHLARRSFATLSGGEKQRVIIASALAQAASILLLDEPTASLDLGYQLEVAVLLRKLNADRKLTVLVATHDLNFAAGLCGEMFLMREGRKIAAGPTDTVLTTAAIRQLYGVEADVRPHDAAGHLIVTPLRIADDPFGVRR